MLRRLFFSAHQRIRERQNFQQVFQKGKRLYGSCFILYYYPNDLLFARVGVIVSKRNVRKAVQRNQIKRTVREIFRRQQAHIKLADIVVVAQSKAGKATKEEIKQCLEQLFIKLKK